MGFISRLFGKKGSTNSNLYEEVQSILRTTLTPLGFNEKEGWGVSNLTKFVDFTRGDITVTLWLDRRDSIYHLEISSQSEFVNNEKRPVLDISIECSSPKEAEQFKRDSMSKLNEWLVRQNLR